MTSHIDARTARVIHFYETLTPASLSQLEALYTHDARFKDPFNHVQGLKAIERVFSHMFETLNAPRFEVLSADTVEDHAWLTWDFIIQRPGKKEWRIHGATRLTYASDGRITQHRDYWDPAEELYARLPLLGPLVRWLTRRLSAST